MLRYSKWMQQACGCIASGSSTSLRGVEGAWILSCWADGPRWGHSLRSDRAVDDLPAGWTDQQDGGTYRLKKRGDAALFGYAVGPHSWKKFLFPPRQRLFSARRTETGFEIKPETEDAPSTRSSASGRASCTRSRFRTRFSWGSSPIRYIGRGARRRSSSR